MRDRNAALERRPAAAAEHARTALSEADVPGLAWDRMGGLIPAAVQDRATGELLMLGYMSPASLAATLSDGRVTFHSRSRNRLWRKGETSGNVLAVEAVLRDCDGDALLVLAEPAGPTCHLGADSCFAPGGPPGPGWIGTLARIVRERRYTDPADSYTARLLRDGPVRIAQKVGEEGVELALAAGLGDRKRCIEETADLVYHLTVLMEARGYDWGDVVATLKRRHAP